MESIKTETNLAAAEKRKVEGEATSMKKKKQKADKAKDIMVLTEGDLGQIGDSIQEETTESWNKVEDCYDALMTSVIKRIAKLKILAQTVRQPTQIEERVRVERQIEPMFAARLAQIHVGALHLDSIEIQQ